ncbi:MAG TPA: tetratricopeptide repeat protein [Steroidobacteraceae bacterium]|nr:tetratricopeptide repeat protein [Steroidobacteraceae bacterium]
MSLYEELKRRQVFRVAVLYAGIAWLTLQAADMVLPAFHAPDWVFRALIVIGLIGFVIVIVLAWLYELTAQGLKRDAEVVADKKLRPLFGGRTMNPLLISVLAIALGISLYGNYRSKSSPAVEMQPVSVLIADLSNRTGDAVFDGTLEEALGVGLEGAPFITNYQREQARELGEHVRPSSRLDEEVARLVAVRENINVVLAGTIEPSGEGYSLSVRAINPTDGSIIEDARADASSRDLVLAAVGRIAAQVRMALGDTSLKGGQLADEETFTAASLEAASYYTRAQALAARNKDADALPVYEKAVEADPEFARAYSGWGLSAFKLGRRTEATEKWNSALKLLDRMTERERYRTLGLYYSVVSLNYEKAIDNYSQLVRLYPADGAGHNNLAISYFMTLNFPAALAEGKRLLEMYPEDIQFRANYALYAMYASDLKAAVEESGKVLKADPAYYLAYLPVAMQAMTIPDSIAARRVYERAATQGDSGASLAAIGLADVALYEGKAADAENILPGAIAKDQADSNEQGVASKRAALAKAYILQGKRSQALDVLRELTAKAATNAEWVPAALLYAELGEVAETKRIADRLRGDLQPQSRAYAKVLDGLLALRAKRAVEAVDALKTALGFADLWLVRYMLGEAYLAAGYPAEAKSEFEACVKRRGEVMALFLDDTPTYRYYAPVPQRLAATNADLVRRLSATTEEKE